MDTFTETRVIAEVKKNEVLWNKIHEDYKKSRLKGKIWESVAATLGLEKSIVKNKWTVLTKQFWKEYRLQTITGSNGLKSSWIHYEEMAFLGGQRSFRTSGNSDHLMDLDGGSDDDIVDEEVVSAKRDSSEHLQSTKYERCQSELESSNDLLFLTTLLPDMQRVEKERKLLLRNDMNRVILSYVYRDRNISSTLRVNRQLQQNERTPITHEYQSGRTRVRKQDDFEPVDLREEKRGRLSETSSVRVKREGTTPARYRTPTPNAPNFSDWTVASSMREECASTAPSEYSYRQGSATPAPSMYSEYSSRRHGMSTPRPTHQHFAGRPPSTRPPSTRPPSTRPPSTSCYVPQHLTFPQAVQRCNVPVFSQPPMNSSSVMPIYIAHSASGVGNLVPNSQNYQCAQNLEPLTTVVFPFTAPTTPTTISNSTATPDSAANTISSPSQALQDDNGRAE